MSKTTERSPGHGESGGEKLGHDDEDGDSIVSSDYGDAGNMGVRHVDSGSDDSDIDIQPIVTRPFNQYYDSDVDDSTDGSVPPLTNRAESSDDDASEDDASVGEIPIEEHNLREQTAFLGYHNLRQQISITDLPVAHTRSTFTTIEQDQPPVLVCVHAYMNDPGEIPSGLHFQLRGFRKIETMRMYSAHQDSSDVVNAQVSSEIDTFRMYLLPDHSFVLNSPAPSSPVDDKEGVPDLEGLDLEGLPDLVD
jgi:hypothetical protein